MRCERYKSAGEASELVNVILGVQPFNLRLLRQLYTEGFHARHAPATEPARSAGYGASP